MEHKCPHFFPPGVTNGGDNLGKETPDLNSSSSVKAALGAWRAVGSRRSNTIAKGGPGSRLQRGYRRTKRLGRQAAVYCAANKLAEVQADVRDAVGIGPADRC